MDKELILDLLKRHEGLRLKPYLCSAGKLTIGYGHNLDNPISEEVAEAILMTDMAIAIQECIYLEYWPHLSEVRQAVIVDMVFNLGMSRFKKFKKMRAAIMKRDFKTASQEMLDSKWARQVGGRAIRLSKMMETNKAS